MKEMIAAGKMSPRRMQEASGMNVMAFPQVASQLWVQKLEYFEYFRHLWDSVTESDTQMGCLAPLTPTGGASRDTFFPVKRREGRKEITGERQHDTQSEGAPA